MINIENYSLIICYLINFTLIYIAFPLKTNYYHVLFIEYIHYYFGCK